MNSCGMIQVNDPMIRDTAKAKPTPPTPPPLKKKQGNAKITKTSHHQNHRLPKTSTNKPSLYCIESTVIPIYRFKRGCAVGCYIYPPNPPTLPTHIHKTTTPSSSLPQKHRIIIAKANKDVDILYKNSKACPPTAPS